MWISKKKLCLVFADQNFIYNQNEAVSDLEIFNIKKFLELTYITTVSLVILNSMRSETELIEKRLQTSAFADSKHDF